MSCCCPFRWSTAHSPSEVKMTWSSGSLPAPAFRPQRQSRISSSSAAPGYYSPPSLPSCSHRAILSSSPRPRVLFCGLSISSGRPFSQLSLPPLPSNDPLNTSPPRPHELLCSRQTCFQQLRICPCDSSVNCRFGTPSALAGFFLGRTTLPVVLRNKGLLGSYGCAPRFELNGLLESLRSCAYSCADFRHMIASCLGVAAAV